MAIATDTEPNVSLISSVRSRLGEIEDSDLSDNTIITICYSSVNTIANEIGFGYLIASEVIVDANGDGLEAYSLPFDLVVLRSAASCSRVLAAKSNMDNIKVTKRSVSISLVDQVKSYLELGNMLMDEYQRLATRYILRNTTGEYIDYTEEQQLEYRSGGRG